MTKAWYETPLNEDTGRAAGNRAYLEATRKPARRFKVVKRSSFYTSPAWMKVRYRALKRNDGRCECCGASKHDGVKLQVDHIKPRSKYPKLELRLDNLQVLCTRCNAGKSSWDETDWRLP